MIAVPQSIDVTSEIYLSPIVDEDKQAYLEYFKEKEISDNTLRISYPYTEKDAEKWIRINKDLVEQGLVGNWAIRKKGAPYNALIGGIGFAPPFKAHTIHASEIGFWLAKPFWNQGIMTQVVGKLCNLAFMEFGLIRITAYVFSFNAAAGRVLEKCGFEKEGYLRKSYIKNGQFIDINLYARVI